MPDQLSVRIKQNLPVSDSGDLPSDIIPEQPDKIIINFVVHFCHSHLLSNEPAQARLPILYQLEEELNTLEKSSFSKVNKIILPDLLNF